MAVNQCTIPPNPDVSGVGVRAAIYAQNILCFLPVIVHLWDGKISRDELKGIKDQSIGMLAVAFAILFTVVILAKGAGGDQTITSYHAAIVLDLSWINNTSTWIWFILFVHHRSKRDEQPTRANWHEWRATLLAPLRELLPERTAGSDRRFTRANWCKWCTTLLAPLRKLLHRRNTESSPDGPPPDIPQREARATLLAPLRKLLYKRNEGAGDNTGVTEWDIAQRQFIAQRQGIARRRGIAQRIWCLVSQQPVLTLGSIHLSLMAAVGIWLWSDPSKFGHPIDCDPALTVVGVPAHFSSKPLRIASLTMYSLVLVPGFNLILPFIFFLTLHITYNWSRERHQLFWTWWDNALHAILKVCTLSQSPPSSDAEQGSLSQVPAIPAVTLRPPSSSSASRNPPSDSSPPPSDAEQGNPSQVLAVPAVEQRLPESSSANRGTDGPNPPPHTAFLIVGLVFLVAINILFIVDIELSLRRNKGDQNGAEAAWGFGQVLALLLLIIPLRDAWNALQDIRDKLKGIQEQFEQLLQRECQATPVVKQLEHLIQKGANPNLWTADPRFGSTLQLVAYYGKIELVEFLLQEPGIIEDKADGGYGTALQVASARGHVPIVKILLGSNKYNIGLNAVGGQYGTALCAACANGKVEVVDVLRQAGASLNVRGRHFGAPLHVAVLMESKEMVTLLLALGPDDTYCQWEGVGSAADVAALLNDEEMFNLLWGNGVRAARDDGARGGDGQRFFRRARDGVHRPWANSVVLLMVLLLFFVTCSIPCVNMCRRIELWSRIGSVLTGGSGDL